MELSLIVVLLVGAVLIWAGYQVFFAKKKSEVKSESVAPYKLEPRTQIGSETKPTSTVTQAPIENSVRETKPELKVVNGSKAKSVSKRTPAKKPAAKKSVATAKKSTSAPKNPRPTTEK
jgi:hypothetical protein